MKKLLVVLSVAILISSCGKESKKKVPQTVYPWTTTNISERPVRLSKQDITCPNIKDQEAYTIFEIDQFIDGAKVQSKISFESQVRNNYVESSISMLPIFRTYFGMENYMVIDATYNETKGEYEFTPGKKPIHKEVGKAQKLTVCPGTERYENLSYEASGLNVSNSITKTFEAVSRVSSFYLFPIQVNIAPITYKNVTYHKGPYNDYKIEGYETDNAYYDPSMKMITFLPQSKGFKDGLIETPFWEIPMVGSHEYGHHIFQTLVVDKINTVMKHSEACFENKTTLRNKAAATNPSSTRDNTMKFALGSINEGFADLISYYALDEKERSLKGIMCFTKNREVGSDEFAMGAKKAFTKSALKSMNSKLYEAPDRLCDTPDYQEIHNVGAMFAHGADKILSLNHENRDEKLGLILEWAQTFAKEYKNLEKLEVGKIMFHSLELLYKLSLEKAGETATSESCKMLAQVFPDEPGYECPYLHDFNEDIKKWQQEAELK